MRFSVVLMACVVLSTPTIAAPITYTYSGNFSGSLAGNSFFNQPITIIGVSDTDTVTASYGGALLTNNFSAIYINVASVGSAAFLGYNNIVYTDLGPSLGVNGTGINSVVDFLDSEYSLGTNYDLRTNLGPLPVIFRGGGAGMAETTVGQLALSRATSTVTFIASVPEPSSLALLLFITVVMIIQRFRNFNRNLWSGAIYPRL